MNPRPRGFTLIELMIVVVIIGILAAIAYPSYKSFVQRSNRAEAKNALLENAQFLERNYTVANRYDQDSGGNAIALPIQQAPRSGTAKYTVTVEPTASTFRLEAAPVAGGPMADDACGTLVLTNTGLKEVEGASEDAAVCWGR